MIQRKERRGSGTIGEILDFPMGFCREKIPDKGEDAWLFYYTDRVGAGAVFDGCGGAGATKYPGFKGNKSGAYMSSRTVSGAAAGWVNAIARGTASPKDTHMLKRMIIAGLEQCRRQGKKTSKFVGSLMKDFPTTAAMVVTVREGDGFTAHCIWAGDSRCYMLDESGLKQLTEDDLAGIDPMENITADGAMTNMISLSSDFVLHEKAVPITGPCLLLAATDGCFSYLSTPMEFEYLLLHTLSEANSPEQWEDGISAKLQEIAGDDYSLSGAAYGFGSFAGLKNVMSKRTAFLKERYIDGLREKSREEKLKLWRIYSQDYSRYLEG